MRAIKEKFKNRRLRKIDKFIAKEIIMSIGHQPTSLTYNDSRKYWEISWDNHNGEYLKLKVSSKLYMNVDSNTRVKAIWYQFVHPRSADSGLQAWPITDGNCLVNLIYNCREALSLLHSLN